MKLKITFLLIGLIQICFAQSENERKWHITQYHKDLQLGNVYTQIDTIRRDTGIYCSDTRRYTEKSKNGILLVEGYKYGGMGTKCGCKLKPDGYWIERYRNGVLKVQGSYDCGRKSNTWIYYFEDGVISKIENYKRPYLEVFTEEELGIEELKNNYLLSGPYLEYYKNGKLKISGVYEIIEEYSETDTLYTFDEVKMEMIGEVIEGDFWIPKSKKSEIWSKYNENGELISQEIYRLEKWEESKVRSIDYRYGEVIRKIIELDGIEPK